MTTALVHVPREVYYRVESRLYSPLVDQFGKDIGPPILKLQVQTFEVLKHTPKGVWINGPLGKKFVLASARRRYANATEAAAFSSFIARKKKQIRILERQMQNALRMIVLAKGRLEEATPLTSPLMAELENR